MLDHEYGNIVWRCDGDSCSSKLDTNTARFDNAKTVLDRAGWQTKKVGEAWLHFCPRCKLAFGSRPADMRRYGDE